MPRRPRRLPPYCYEDTDRHGNVRVYLRKPGYSKVRLRGVALTPDFMAQYERALSGTTAPARISLSKRETWRWLCEQYMASDQFKSLSGTTLATRRRNLEWTWDQPINPDEPNMLFGDMPISKMTSKAIRVFRTRKSKTKAAANLLLKIVGYVFTYGLEEHDGIVLTNPVRDVKKIKYESDGWHTWTQNEIAQFMDFYPPGSKERRAMALLIYTGARGCDARHFGPQMIREGWLSFHQQKLAKNPRGWVKLPLHTALVRELELAPRDALAFILTPYGKTYSQKGFGNWFNDKCRVVGLADCTAHGLRKAAATIAADNGATVHQLMAMFGWMTEQQAIHYTKEVDRRRLAAAAVPLVNLERNAV